MESSSSILIADCPRCRALSVTFDVRDINFDSHIDDFKSCFEAFCVCRHCIKSTIFILAPRSGFSSESVARIFKAKAVTLNAYVSVKDYVNLTMIGRREAPKHLPPEILKIFEEGSINLATKTFNSAGTSFRLCVQLATNPLLPEDGKDGLTPNIRRNLGLRLPWLFRTKKLSEDLHDLSTCVKEDGNCGAHEGALTEADAEDLFDFTFALLDRLFTEPARLKQAQARQSKRRQQSKESDL